MGAATTTAAAARRPPAPSFYGTLDRADLPDAAVLASLGCGNPTAVAELREGETVLDLGSGGGIDVILSAKRVGPSGKAYGLDMTDEMLSLARGNAADAGVAERRVPQGLHRGGPAAGRERRRGDLELRDQPVDRQVEGVRRDAPRPASRRARGRRGRDRRRRAHRRSSARSAAATRGASPERSRSRSTARAWSVPGSRTSRSCRRTRARRGSSPRSCGRAARSATARPPRAQSTGGTPRSSMRARTRASISSRIGRTCSTGRPAGSPTSQSR